MQLLFFNISFIKFGFDSQRTLRKSRDPKGKASWLICTASRRMESWLESLVTSDPTVDLKLSRYEYPGGCRPWAATQSIAFGRLDEWLVTYHLLLVTCHADKGGHLHKWSQSKLQLSRPFHSQWQSFISRLKGTETVCLLPWRRASRWDIAGLADPGTRVGSYPITRTGISKGRWFTGWLKTIRRCCITWGLLLELHMVWWTLLHPMEDCLAMPPTSRNFSRGSSGEIKSCSGASRWCGASKLVYWTPEPCKSTGYDTIVYFVMSM